MEKRALYHCHSAGQWYRARFSTLSIATGGIRVIGILLKEGFDAY